MREKENETYLGDSVAASFDGQMLWLRTTDGNNQRIALEFDVFEREAARNLSGGFCNGCGRRRQPGIV